MIGLTTLSVSQVFFFGDNYDNKRNSRGLGGKAFVVFTGDVSACEAAVRAAEQVEGAQGLLSQSVVIPAPNMELIRSIY